MSNDDIDFHHPYTPYRIQEELMHALYQCIEQGKVGIFESPTGTGKSLSLLCSSLTWLRNHKRAPSTDAIALTDDDEPDWIRKHSETARKRELIERRTQLEDRLADVRRQEAKIRQPQRGAPPRKRIKIESTTSNAHDESQFLLDDYESDDASEKKSKPRLKDELLSNETRELLRKAGVIHDQTDDPVEAIETPKVLICSRTHSQLSQLVGELDRISLPSAFSKSLENGLEEYPIEQVKQISLGSRKNLCVNEKVRSLGTSNAINEKCLELQDKKTPPEKKCKYVLNKDNQALSLDFKYHTLAKARDIEELSQLGTRIGICPYYASRSAIPEAELVTLPYPLLLQKSARKVLELSLRDHVVIIDEAHNLMDAIVEIHSAEINLMQLETARSQMLTYLQKFRNRLAGKNRVYAAQTVRLLDSIKACLTGLGTKSDGEDGLVQPEQLLSGPSVDQINIYKLLQYLQTSKLARKIQGYATFVDEARPGVEVGRAPSPALTTFEHFISTLVNPAREGRYLWYKGKTVENTRVKYLLVDPAEHLRDIVEEARSVILIGGTMSPMKDYETSLFPYVDRTRLTSISCGHVVSKENLYVGILTKTIDGRHLDFTFSKRDDGRLIEDLGRTIVTLVSSIPDGVVIFFPSYSYLDKVVDLWRQTSILQQLSELKTVHIDSQKSDTDAILVDYTNSIDRSTKADSIHKKGGPATRGAILLSVIGGKLSEGINFSDALGRCVMVVGLPYPNPHGAEWRAREAHVEARAGADAARRGVTYVKGTASRDMADDVCMRAVNQAIGRAIRHKDDWAGVLLLDGRYARKRIRDRLPGWMKESMSASVTGNDRFEDAAVSMAAFFAARLSTME